MSRKVLLNFGLSITALLAVLLLFGMTVSTAHADVGFLDHSDLSQSTISKPQLERTVSIGNGWTGSVTSMSIYVTGSGDLNFPYQMTLFGFVDEADANSQGVFNPPSYITTCQAFSSGSFNTYPGVVTQSSGFTSPDCTMDPDLYYVVTVVGGGNGTHYNFQFGGSDTNPTDWTVTTCGAGCPFGGNEDMDPVDIPYFLIEGIDQATPTNLTTKITAITPAPDSTVSTSTSFTFGGKGHITAEDWTEDTVLYIRYGQQTGMGKRGNGPINQRGEITIPITASGDFDLSTTTPISNTGVYMGYIAIQKPKFSLFGFNFFTETLKANTWLFTAGTSTQAELDATVLLISTTGAGQNLASTTLTTSELGACQNFLTGSTTECLISLVVPSGEQLTGAADSLNTALSNNLPFSMFWQPYTLLKSISGSTTPIAGTDVTVDMHDTFITGSTTIFSWTGAKDTVDAAIPNSAVLYLIYAEWIFFGLYCIWRLTKSLS